MRKIAFSLLLVIPISLFSQNRTLSPTELALQQLVQDAGLVNGSVSFCAINLDNGRVLAEHYPVRAMTPASIQKLLTTAVALEKLGPGFTFETKLSTDGVVQDGVLKGNLYVLAGGDPTLQSRYFQNEPDHLSQILKGIAGATKVEGRLVIDASMYARYTTPRGWIWEDMGNYFGASPSALMWKDNLLEVQLRSGQPGTRAMMATPMSSIMGFEWDIQVNAANDQKDNAWFFGSPGNKIIYAKGTIPAHQSKFVVKAAHPFPMEQFATDLQNAGNFKFSEIRVEHDRIERPSLVPLATVRSPNLSALIRVTNQRSINLFAEAINVALDTAKSGKSVEGGLSVMHDFLNARKVNTKGLRLMDGSGLSPLNRMTCRTMVDVLTMMYRSQNKEHYMNSLAVAGQSGTLSNYFKGTKVEGNLKGKSGTMAGVRNYSGYISNKYQENIAFCLIINDYDDARKAEIMKKIEALLVALIED